MSHLWFSTLSIKDLMIKIAYDYNIMFMFSIVVIGFLSALYLFKRSPKVYLVDFACYKAEEEIACKWSHDMLEVRGREKDQLLTEKSLIFSSKVLELSGLGQETYLPSVFKNIPLSPTLADARKELEIVMFGAINELLQKTGVKPKDIAILITNCSAFNPAPSLSSLVVNKFQMRENIMSYNLAGMGCSGSTNAIDLAKNLLKLHKESYVLIFSTENITYGWYKGNNRSMLLTNLLFRVGGAAALLSNRKSDHRRSKYQLDHSLRTTLCANDKAYRCVYEQEDEDGHAGYYLSREMMVVAGDCLKANITALGPLVLPATEKLRFVANLVARKLFKMSLKPYVPNFKLAFEHILVHPGGKAVIDAVRDSLKLTEWDVEAARMTLYRYGNTSSSSLWYVLAYTEAKGRVREGDRLWKISFGSGYKCNSVVWRALKTIDPAKQTNLWMDEIHKFPVDV